MTRTLREAIASGEPLVGAWLQMPNPVAAEAVGRAGFDWVGIDTQHGLIGYETLLAMLQAVSISGTPTVVRVSGNHAGEIGRALDSGAQGIIVPLIETAEDAARAVDACRYPPHGHRSWGALRHAMEREGYTPAMGDDLAVVFAMTETVTAVDNIDAIAAVKGVDVVYVGPSDLASSAGMRPQLKLEEPEHRELVRRIGAAATAAGKACGIHPPTPDVAMYRDMGFSLYPVYRDLPALTEGAVASLRDARTSLQG